MEFRVHWLGVTIWKTEEYALKLWQSWFEPYLGKMQNQGYGARLYETIYTALVDAKLYCTPKLAQSSKEPHQHYHLELPGTACEALPPKLIQEFILLLIGTERYHVSRIDLAWDGVPFTPEDIYLASQSDLFRTYARRNTYRYEISPNKLREDGQLGRSIFRMGSRQSERHLRVYNAHGPVRLEFECRKKRADLVAKDVLKRPPDDWSDFAIPHLRDFLDIDVDYWKDFVQEHARANQTLVDARTKEMSKITKWMVKQVSPSLSVMADVFGEESIDGLIKRGRRKRGDRFDSLLNHEPKFEEDQDEGN